MKTFDRTALAGFLHEIDAQLTSPLTATIVGGAVISLLYDETTTTRDIDFFESRCVALEEACAKATEKSANPVPYEFPGVVDGLQDYEDRVGHVALGLRHLPVVVPERHDLAVMKGLRADAHDLDGLEEMHRRSPLDFDTFIERCWRARAATGHPTTLRRNLIMTAEHLFRRPEAKQAEHRLEGWDDPT